MPDLTPSIKFAQAHEVAWPRDPEADPAKWGVHHEDPPPYNRLRGPVHSRGPVSGVIRQRGREIAAWGEPDRADLTFSVAKTYLGLLAGVANARGLLPDPHEPVIERVKGIGFESAHNRTITWAHLLEQTSEWEGECFGVPDTVDRYRTVSHDPKPPTGRKGDARPLREPGTYGNTTTCASTSCRWRCCICSACRCRRCFAMRSCGRSAQARTGRGKATTTPGSNCRLQAAEHAVCNRYPAARTGAVACRSARAIRH